MALNPKKIREDLEKKEINKSTAIDLLIYLIENNDNFDVRIESIKNLASIGAENKKAFSLFEHLLVSDSSVEIRELAATSLIALFHEKALTPLKWALDHEISWQFLSNIVSSISRIHSPKVKSVLVEKISNFDNFRFNRSLSSYMESNEIENFENKQLAEIIINYLLIQFFEETLREVNYKIEKGYVIELNLSFASDDINGWRILRDLSKILGILNRIKKLILKSNNIGKFPSTILSLPSLELLDLSHNNLANIPNEISSLTSLNKLDLKYNSLIELPLTIGTFKNLKVLDLEHNKLTAIPPSIGRLISLETLNLHGNQLNTLPSSIEGLSSLKILNLGLNELNTSPKWIKKLGALKILSLGGNKNLPKFEEWIDFLPSIIELNLYDNNIKALPESIGIVDSLEALTLPNNHIICLPESFKRLSSLRNLDLSWNDLSELPKWFGSLSKLEYLNLRGNKLSSLPESLSSLGFLKYLNVSLNQTMINISNLGKKDIEIIK